MRENKCRIVKIVKTIPTDEGDKEIITYDHWCFCRGNEKCKFQGEEGCLNNGCSKPVYCGCKDAIKEKEREKRQEGE